MCGFTGFFAPHLPFDAQSASAIARRMSDATEHRGPDGEGVWLDWTSGIAFAHRRLSILDLSPAGAQPMASQSERFIITFNGEIYNHLDLRDEIERAQGAIQWRGTSDTETLLAGIEHWGFETTLKKIHGMFAFALWDKKEKCLIFARDRLGEKPLYYGQHAGALLFGSELKSLIAFSDQKLGLNSCAVANFLKYSYIPAPMSIYQGIYKLPPASYIVLRSLEDKPSPQQYWSIEAVAEQSQKTQFTQDRETVIDEIEAVLSKSIKSQLISDVPLGVFLSGGIDSTLITSLMTKLSPQKVKSFSIGFEDANFNEAIYAREIAQYLQTDHHEFMITEADALNCIPKIPITFDEPFADSSQIPTLILSEKTRDHVTVALSGDGGDEIFGGYNRYLFAPKIWNMARRIPRQGRKMIGGLSTRLQSQQNSGDGQGIAKVFERLGLPKTSVKRLSKFGNAIGNADDFDQFFQNLISAWPDYTQLTTGYDTAPQVDFNTLTPSLSLAERMMIFDSQTYMPDDILVKVDRSAMASSLETRAPFLDPNVIAAAWQVPLSQKIEKGSGKTILKDILHRHVPKDMFDRPKQGFSIPIDDWLRGQLKDWAGDHLTSANFDLYPFLNAKKVQQVFSAHLSGVDNFGHQLWPIVTLMAWTEVYR